MHVLAERRAWQRRESILRSLGKSREKVELEYLAMPGEGWPAGNCGMSSLPKRVREHLKELARRRETITYRDLAKGLEVQPPNTIHEVADALEVLMREDHATAAPFLAALVVSKVRNGLPAPVFFYVARMLGRFKGLDAGSDIETYHARELESAWDYWSSSNSR